MIQLDFLSDDDMPVLKAEIKRLKESNEKVRKSLFATYGELAKNYLELLCQMEILDKYICNGSYAGQKIYK